MQCLNLKNKEVKAAFDEVAKVLNSEDAAYYVISENNGYAIDQDPDGSQSQLFQDLLQKYNGDRDKAKNREELRLWLENNYETQKECWVIVKRGKSQNDDTFWYIDAVEEALCFGWIDSTVKNLIME